MSNFTTAADCATVAELSTWTMSKLKALHLVTCVAVANARTERTHSKGSKEGLSYSKARARHWTRGTGTASAKGWSSRGGRAQPSSLVPLLSVLDSDSLLAQQPRHRFSCAPADGRPLSLLPPRAVSAAQRSTVTWEDVAFGTMVGRSSLRYNSLESKLLKLAQKTYVPRPPDPTPASLQTQP